MNPHNSSIIKEISPVKIKSKEWSLIKDLLLGDGEVGFHRGNKIFVVDKAKARQFIQERGLKQFLPFKVKE